MARGAQAAPGEEAALQHNLPQHPTPNLRILCCLTQDLHTASGCWNFPRCSFSWSPHGTTGPLLPTKRSSKSICWHMHAHTHARSHVWWYMCMNKHTDAANPSPRMPTEPDTPTHAPEPTQCLGLPNCISENEKEEIE